MNDTTQQGSQSAGEKSRFIRTYAKDVAALAGTQGGGAAPVAQAAPEPPRVPPPPPREIPRPAPPQPAADPNREETLARLRKRVEEAKREAPPPPPPLPPPPVPLPPPPAPVAERPSPIHTYKSDFADRIDEKGAATFSVLAAQQDAAPRVALQQPKKRNTALIAGAIALMVLGGAGLGAAAWYVVRSNVLPGAPLAAPTLVFADEQVRLSSSGPDLMSEMAALANEPLPEGHVLVLYLAEATTTPKGETVEIPLAGGALIRAMQLPAPDILLRNVTGDSTVGIIHAGEETRPFFVFGVSSYERTFAGMLAWETSIARDLVALYPARERGALAPAATTTALGTSTPSVAMPVRPTGSFTDAVVANHDVRVLRDSAGQALMLYGYAGKDLLVLARDEAAFAALLTRLSAER